VYEMKTRVYLGPDTIRCIGKDITLNAGNGFKSYEWQDGSVLKTFTTNDTGMFHVKVIDSCNSTFRDSVYIFHNPKNLNIAYSSRLCEFDTAKILLTADFNNFSWQPFSNTLKLGDTLLLFPTATTLYSVSAQSHNNCFLTDTLLLYKRDCYGSLYFPTAFTPNNDGLNDYYRPIAIGILQSYHFTIYNRYGMVVFQSNDISKGWDGKFKDQVLAGGYTWVCTYLFRSRKQETESGSFVLLQ
jgi:gliding motility-associated-like protein